MKARAPLMVGGDLHAIAAGQIRRSGVHDLADNPVTTVVAGLIGTDPKGWPSHARGTAPKAPTHLEMHEHFTPVEQHGFTLLDFSRRPHAIAVLPLGSRHAVRRGHR